MGDVAGLALARERHPRCRASEEQIAAALTGSYRREHLFQLRQALELYDHSQVQIQACDREIEQLLGRLAAARPEPAPTSSAERRSTKPRGNEPASTCTPVSAD